MDIDLSLVLTLALILVLLLASAFFAASETAITGASRPRMHALERRGNERARLVNRLRESKERLIGAILLGNNLANILASALATSLLIDWFGHAGVAYATIVMTALVLLFGEVMPKTYAINHSDRVALATAPLVRAVTWLFGPVTHGIEVLVRTILRLFGIRIGTAVSGLYHEEELRGAIDLHHGPEPETVEERRMLRSVLDLDDVAAGEIMIHRKDVETIEADLPTARIIDQAAESRYSRIPLWRGEPDNIVGVLHSRALLRALRANAGSFDTLALDSAIVKPWFIPESTTLLHQLRSFRDRREHMAFVVDEYGSWLGIVTLEDVLEEIVGDITDELEMAARGGRHEAGIRVAGVRPEPGGTYVVRGSVTIRDLNREFDWRLPDEEAHTLAGLVMHQARAIPEPGQVFTFFGFRFEILRRQRNQITAIRVTPPPLEGGK
ncbi:MAG TPA: HlyC/CorC family transporter [Alphaproteobacteria bacterium]|nr:HlyC/CorC family transporter [Alphaproteobacteria bacterium]